MPTSIKNKSRCVKKKTRTVIAIFPIYPYQSCLLGTNWDQFVLMFQEEMMLYLHIFNNQIVTYKSSWFLWHKIMFSGSKKTHRTIRIPKYHHQQQRDQPSCTKQKNCCFRGRMGQSFDRKWVSSEKDYKKPQIPGAHYFGRIWEALV